MVVTLRESNAKFTFNFRDVYWNSRLQTEHDRIIALLHQTYSKNVIQTNHLANNKGNISDLSRISQGIVADMMAGIGPFSIPLSMNRNKHIRVHANGEFLCIYM